MGRWGLGTLLALAVACGGRAEHDSSTTDGGSAGSAGTLIGIGGISIAAGGASGGAGGSAGTLSLGGSSGDGPGRRQTQIMYCDHGYLEYFGMPTPPKPTGFEGMFDDMPTRLGPADSYLYPQLPGSITGQAFSCLSGTTFTIRLVFGYPHDGEQLQFEVGMGNVCEVTAGYWLDASGTQEFPVDIYVTLVVFDPPIDVPEKTTMLGEFTAYVAEPLGHVIDGGFSVVSDHPICLL